MRFRSAWMIMVVSVLTTGWAYGDIRAHRIIRTGAPPRIDGLLDDGCWETALRFERFHPLNEMDTRAVPPTVAMMTYDEDYLYIAYRCGEPLMDKLATLETRHDGKVWMDDSVEIFLNPSGDRVHYFQIVVNAAGVMRDASFVGGPDSMDLSWESGSQAKTRRGENEWSAEIRIPIDSLSLAGPETPWTFQLGRSRCPVPQYLTMLDVVMKGYHNIDKFDRLEGFRFSNRPVGFLGATMGESFQGTNVARVRLLNHGGKAETVRAVVTIEGEEPQTVSGIPVPPGKLVECDIPWTLGPVADRRVRLDVFLGKQRVGGIQRVIEDVPEILGTPLRKAFFMGPDPSVRISVPVNLAEGSRRDAVLRWVVSNTAGQKLGEGTSPVIGNNVSLEISWYPWRPGRFTLNLILEINGRQRANSREMIFLVEDPFAQ